MDSIIEQAKHFPPLKKSVSLCLEKLNDPDISFEILAKVISTDPQLTASLLKLANSPFYRVSREVSSIQDACVLLGRYSLKNLVLSLIALEQFSFTNSDVIDRDKLWQQSVLTGCIAKELAILCQQDRDTALTIGLLHCLGKLILVWISSDKYQLVNQLISEQAKTDVEAEIEIFGHDHASLGSQLLYSWNVPDIICDTIKEYPKQYQEPSMILPSIILLSHISSKAIIENKNTLPDLSANECIHSLCDFLEITPGILVSSCSHAYSNSQQFNVS